MVQTLHIRQRGETLVVSGQHRMRVRHGTCGEASTSDAVGAEWDWDGTRLEATTDRFGTFPLYYSVGADEVCVSTSILSLLEAGVSAELDDTAVATFLRMGCCLGDDTPFAAIRRVPPAGRLAWAADGSWSVTGGAARITPTHLSRDEAIDAFIEVFQAAVRRGLPKDNVIVPLTGGRDSRHILLALCAAGCRPRAVTVRYFPPRIEEDARVASMLAASLGVECDVLPQYESRVASEIRKNQLSEFTSDWHAWFLPFVDRLAVEPSPDVYIGYGGDTLARGRWPNKERRRLWDAGDVCALADHQLQKRPWTELALQLVLQPAAYERFGPERARARLIEELGKHVDQPNPDLAYTFYTGLRRRTAPQWFPMCSDVANISVPFLDAPVFDLLASLPLGLELGPSFHTDAIARAYPQHADVPYANTKGMAPRQDVAYFRRFAGELTAYAMSKRTSDIFSMRHLIERFSGCRRSGDGNLIDWLQPARILFLLQLESIASGRGAQAND